MTLENALLTILQVMLLLNWPMAAVLVYKAYQKPRIAALSFMALFAVVIALAITVYVLAVINAGGHFFDENALRVFFRLVLIALGTVPIVFFGMLATNRFKDGH